MYVTNLCDRGKIKHGSQHQRTHSNGFKAVHSVVWESQSSSDHPTWTHKKQVPLAELTRREGSQQVRRERRHSSLIQHLWVSFGLELWHIWYGPTNLLILRMKSWVSVGNISLIFAVPHREGQKTDIVLILYRGYQVWIKWLAKTPFPQIIICSHIWANKPQLLILKLELFVEESSLYRTENMTSTRVLCFLFVKWCSTPGLCCHRQFPVSGIKTYCCLNMEKTQGSTKTSEIKCPSSFEGLKLLITHFPLIYIFFFQIPIQTPELWSSIWESQRAYSKAKRK